LGSVFILAHVIPLNGNLAEITRSHADKQSVLGRKIHRDNLGSLFLEVELPNVELIRPHRIRLIVVANSYALIPMLQVVQLAAVVIELSITNFTIPALAAHVRSEHTVAFGLLIFLVD
jgi:hypothetical protein